MRRMNTNVVAFRGWKLLPSKQHPGICSAPHMGSCSLGIINTNLRDEQRTGLSDHRQFEWISEVVSLYTPIPEAETGSQVLLLHTG